MTRRQNKHTRNIEESRQLRLVAEAAESNIRQPVLPRLFFERDSLFAVSDNQKIGQGTGYCSY
jgi:hypothetical protein